jgi:hypothetical protein
MASKVAEIEGMALAVLTRGDERAVFPFDNFALSHVQPRLW